jgi:hypothetical protein
LWVAAPLKALKFAPSYGDALASRLARRDADVLHRVECTHAHILIRLHAYSLIAFQGGGTLRVPAPLGIPPEVAFPAVILGSEARWEMSYSIAAKTSSSGTVAKVVA